MRIDDEWLAYQFDSVVSYIGNVIEGAQMETYKEGTGVNTKVKNKYTIKQLLDPDFLLPDPTRPNDNIDALKGMEGVGYDEVT